MDFLPLFLEEAAELTEKWQQCQLRLESDGSDPESWNALFRIVHTLKGSSRAVNLTEFGAYLHLIEDYISGLRDGKYSFDNAAKGSLSESLDRINEWLQSIGMGNPEQDKPNIQTTVNFFTLKTKGATQEPQSSYPAPSQSAPIAPIAPVAPVAPTAKSQNTAINADQNLRIAASKVDDVIRRISEISTQVAMLHFSLKQTEQMGSQKLILADEVSQSLRGLRELSMTLRLESLTKFFGRMEKVARDVSRVQSKSVSIEVRGRDIELDKIIADRIVDPFVHVVRNAVDHGLENAEQRSQNGKKPEGRLLFEARSNGNTVEISVSDDGKGMDPDFLHRKAIEKGIISIDAKLTLDDKINLILRPGFSTAEKVTDISGRGVGLDVVGTAIRELGGKLSIKSIKGKGSTFTLALPANVAMIDSFIIEVGTQKYVVPKHDVNRIMEFDEKDFKEFSPGHNCVTIDGNLAPIVDLEEYYGLSLPDRPKTHSCLVISTDKGLIAVSVSRIVWEQEVVSSKLTGGFSKMCGLMGSTILANGEPSLLISLKAIVTDWLSIADRPTHVRGRNHAV
jgi:two-component system chemotaxis sensor kinase CheA